MSELIGRLASSTTDAAPRITLYPPAPERRNGMGLIIFPGGGYGGLADHEGKGYAEFFAEAGITCFVVEYRLGSQGYRHPAMLEDALAAVATIRARADEFGLSADRIGVMGSSAGGHLTAHALVAWHQYESDVSLRPDFGILCYPVIDMAGEYAHVGSRRNLLGEDPSEELMHRVSCHEHVSAETPPCFLWHKCEDGSVPVENSMQFAAALRRHGVPFELHVYPRGRHGLGLNTDLPWGRDCVRWLVELNGA